MNEFHVIKVYWYTYNASMEYNQLRRELRQSISHRREVGGGCRRCSWRWRSRENRQRTLVRRQTL